MIDKQYKKYFNKLVTILSVLVLSACSSIPNQFGEEVEDTKPIMAQKEMSNEELLDVSIKVFEAGSLPDDKEDRRGLSEKIRNAEARFMPIHLKYAMQRTGYWGSVRVIPAESEGNEVLVKGKIIKSDGESLVLNIRVLDASNKKWFEKEYEKTVQFENRKETEIEREDVFQDLYNKISNDIIEYRQKLTLSEINKIKQIAELRFSQNMAPSVYENYLVNNKEGQYQLARLPSTDDPMMQRIRNIKARDEMLIDSINNYYDIYYSEMWDNYDNWRKFRSEELETIREIENKAMTQKVLGVAAIIGAIALGASSKSDVVDRIGVLRTVMVAGGTYALYEGFKTSKESEINKEAIEELGESFTTEVEPILIDVDGKTLELTGSADQQYMKWKSLLKEIYHKETGF